MGPGKSLLFNSVVAEKKSKKENCSFKYYIQNLNSFSDSFAKLVAKSYRVLRDSAVHVIYELK